MGVRPKCAFVNFSALNTTQNVEPLNLWVLFGRTVWTLLNPALFMGIEEQEEEEKEE